VSWSVETWVLSHQGRLYVPSLNCLEKRWVMNVLDHDDVRARIDGRVYKLRALREEDRQVQSALIEQLLRKYMGIEAPGAQTANGNDPSHRPYECLFRLEARLPADSGDTSIFASGSDGDGL
jgi:hypothetical protein